MPHRSNFLSQIAPFLLNYKLKLLAITLLLMIPAAFYLAVPLAVQHIFDRAIPQRDIEYLGYILVFLGVAFIVSACADLLQSFLAANLGAGVMRTMRSRMFHHLQKMSLSDYQKTSSGELLSHFSNDLNAIERVVSVTLFNILLNVIVSITSGALLFYIEWRLALITLVALPVALIGPKWLGPRAERSNSEKKKHEAKLVSTLQENILAQKVIRAFRMHELKRRAFRSQLDTLHRSSVRAHFFSTVVGKCMEMAVYFIQISIIVGGAYLAIEGYLTQGALLAFVGLLINVGSAIIQITTLTPDLIQSAAAMQRVSNFLEKPSNIDYSSSRQPLPAFSDKIEFQAVSFGYTDTKLNVDNIRFCIEKGQRVAFVGRSGSGKSTLLNLLTRFFDPDQGCIFFDDHDLRAVSHESLMSQIGIVFQESTLLNGTVRDNIDLLEEVSSDEAIVNAAILAEIHDTIEALPQGYNTVVGESAHRLSGGQQQRIALARVVLNNPAILILDEVTSALDAATEAAIIETLKTIGRHRTVIAVTHRLASVVDYDVIFVLDEGKIIEQGNHYSLLAKDGAYARLWRKQQGFDLSSEGDHAQIRMERLVDIPIFSIIDQAYLTRITPYFVTEHFSKGQIIFNQGEPGDRLYIIVRGSVEVLRKENSGSAKKLAVLQDGDYFGEISLLKNSTRTATLVALSDCMCISLVRWQFLKILDQSKDMREKIEMELVSRTKTFATDGANRFVSSTLSN